MGEWIGLSRESVTSTTEYGPPVQDVAGLRLVAPNQRADKLVIFVEDKTAQYHFDTADTSSADDGDLIIAPDDPSAPNGRWFKIGGGGGPPTGAAGGDLSGSYPNPTVAALAITDAKVAAANKDGASGTASLRTLGTGAQQAAAGNDARLSDSRAPTAHAADHTDGSDDIQDATTGQKGLATAAQITKLDGIATAATIDQTAGDGLQGTSSLSLDLKAAGGLHIEATELELDVAGLAAEGTPTTGDKLIIERAGLPKKIDWDDLPTLPIVDSTAVVKGSVDASKLVRIEADGLTTATTRVLTVPDRDVTLGIHDINISFPEVTTTNGAYTVVAGGRFIFRGTTALGTPTAIKILGGNNGSSTADFRIQDVTNALTIAEVTGNSDANPSVIDLGSLSNLPAAAAVWEIQFLRATGSGGNVPAVCGLQVQY